MNFSKEEKEKKSQGQEETNQSKGLPLHGEPWAEQWSCPEALVLKVTLWGVKQQEAPEVFWEILEGGNRAKSSQMDVL